MSPHAPAGRCVLRSRQPVPPPTCQLLHAFRRDGWLLLRGFASSATVAHLRAALAVALADGHQRDGAAYALRDCLARVPAVARWATTPAVRRVVACLLASGATAISALLLDKVAGANWRLPAHRDLMVPLAARAEVAGWGPWSRKDGVDHAQPPPAVSRRRLALRLHLDDCPWENAPLQVWPGSHRRLADDGSGPPRALTARAGDLLAMHPLLLHASAPAERPGHRRVLHIEFCAARLPPGLAWRASPRACRR